MATYGTISHSAVTVGTSSVQVLAGNPNRLYALYINDSDAVIYLHFGAAAELNKGIRLNPNGGSYEMGPGGVLSSSQATFAISSAAGKNLLVTEGV